MEWWPGLLLVEGESGEPGWSGHLLAFYSAPALQWLEGVTVEIAKTSTWFRVSGLVGDWL